MSKIAVLGHGVVGSGVVELFYKNKEKIEKTAGHELDIKYILDIREFPDSPYKDKFTKSIDDIINDSEVTTAAECMGGVEPAFTFTKQCLEKGISVCTSNKELVAAKGDILFKIAKENNCNYYYEASVGGAIPIIRPLHRCLAGNDISYVAGILNGTTNFILTKMIDEGMKFDDALALAKKLGYAEADPTADVEGHDACRKICIISSLVYGRHVYPDSVYTKGISEVQLKDVQILKGYGAIKLVAQVTKLDGGKILPCVMPTVVPDSSLLSHVNDVFNAVLVKGNGFDETMFYGRGAGKLPTASAVMGDIIDSEKHDRTVESQCWESSDDNSFVEKVEKLESKFYVRAESTDKNAVSGAFGEVEYISENGSELAFVADKMTLAEAKAKAEKIGAGVLLPVME